MSSVRTRVAPSPTGDPHVGTAYIALMNYLYAHQHGGQFILRIEDTDQVRSTRESEEAILKSLKWLGLSWSEGPDVGGPYGPYRQSERSGLYSMQAQVLLDRGHAFKCFCSSERLDGLRKEQQKAGKQPGYDGCCLSLTPAEVAAKEAAGEPYVVRMKVPETGACTFRDMKRGDITIPYANVDMQVLMKSDGLPTYHLANVVDDHDMRITHVLRGEEWVSSAPKHALLYSYFGWQMPELCHLPLLRNPDKSKLSKRKNPTSILYYERMGYLPEALLNLLGLFALNVGEGSEIKLLDDLRKEFSIDHIALGGPVFDMAKLDFLNATHIRALDPSVFAARLVEWMARQKIDPVAALAQTRIERLGDFMGLAGFMWMGGVKPQAAQMTTNKLDAAGAKAVVSAVLERLETLPCWGKDEIGTLVKTVAEEQGVKLKDAVRPLYVAISGSPQSLPLFDSMDLLGRDIVRARLRDALAVI
jgi:glutamyl-tRNA synthetase